MHLTKNRTLTRRYSTVFRHQNLELDHLRLPEPEATGPSLAFKMVHCPRANSPSNTSVSYIFGGGDDLPTGQIYINGQPFYVRTYLWSSRLIKRVRNFDYFADSPLDPCPLTEKGKTVATDNGETQQWDSTRKSWLVKLVIAYVMIYIIIVVTVTTTVDYWRRKGKC
jgi:hypothetical protein